MRKILIVSSDKRLLTLLNRELTIRNYTVLAEADPDKTFIHIGEFAPDMLVVDLILDEHNGGAISRQAKNNPHTNDLPIIVLSAYEPEIRYASRFGCDRVIQKTGDFYPLIDAINDLLEENELVSS
jgi:DNA-binding response OmpR family regulator